MRKSCVLVMIGILLLGLVSCDSNIPNNFPKSSKYLTTTIDDSKVILNWEAILDYSVVEVLVTMQRKGSDEVLSWEVGRNDDQWVSVGIDESGMYVITLEARDTKSEVRAQESVEVFLIDTDLPILYIDTPGRVDITSKEWVNKALGFGLSSFRITNANTDNMDTVLGDIRGRGNSTWGMPKKPYNIKLESKEKLFGMEKHKKWTLLANYSDKSLLRTSFALGLGSNVFDSLAWTPKVQSVELMLNGQYQGVYQVVEKIEIDKKRINIDVESESSTDFLLERDHRVKEGEEEYKFTTDKGLRLSWEKTTDDLSDTVRIDAIKNRVQELEDLIFSYSELEVLAEQIDLPSFIDWYLVNELTKNVDAQGFSSIFMYQKKNKLYMGPLWDFDLSSGNANYYSCDDPEGFYINHMDSAWYYQLFSDTEFVKKVQDRWNDKKGAVLKAINDIREAGAALEEGQRNNFTRWDILGTYVWPNPEWPDTYEGEIERLIGWLTSRYNWLDGALNGL